MTTETQELVYAVIGDSGEYSEHVDWIVSAFYNENDANEYCRLCQVEADRIYNDYISGEGVFYKDNHYDSQYRTYICGKVDYHVQAVNLFNFLPI
jgi:hypothetical protein